MPLEKVFVTFVSLVTGAGQGIGRAIAIRLAKEGAKVIINDKMDGSRVDSVIKETNGFKVIADISKPAEVSWMIREVEKKLGTIEIFIANAASMTMMPFLDQNPKEWWDQVNVNLTGHINCIQKILPGMRSLGRGNIIIISSNFGVIGWKNATGYAASKSGLLTLGESLAKELEKENIFVGIIASSVIDTPQLQVDANDLNISIEEVREMYSKNIPMGRIGKPEEVAATVAFLCKTGGNFLNGRVMQTNGGESRGTINTYC